MGRSAADGAGGRKFVQEKLGALLGFAGWGEPHRLRCVARTGTVCDRAERRSAAGRVLQPGTKLGFPTAYPGTAARNGLSACDRLLALSNAPFRDVAHRPCHGIASALLDPARVPGRAGRIRAVSGGGTARHRLPGIASTPV